MTRILLHPHTLPHYGPSGGARVYLPRPWQWWRTRVLPDPDGYLVHQQYDDPVDIHEASVLFAPLDDGVEIVDPPAMHVIEHQPEFDDINFSCGYTRTLMTRPMTAECEVVWYERPGERWEPTWGNTCRPGDYQIGSADCDDSRRNFYREEMAPLCWPTGRRQPRPRIELYHQTHRTGPAALADRLDAIMAARCDYEAAARGPAAAVLMCREDYEEFRLLALADQQLAGTYEPARRQGLAATIFGLEIRVERNVRPGTVVIMGPDAGPRVNFGDPRRGVGLFQQNPQFPREQVLPGPAAASLRAISDAAMRASTAVGSFAETMGSVAEAAWAFMTPDEIREQEGLPGYIQPDGGLELPYRQPPRGPRILPEQDVVDEIDRLVNEQIKPGPRDDYRVNRYPKCTDCGCDWHGLDCEHCDCINTDWLKDGK